MISNLIVNFKGNGHLALVGSGEYLPGMDPVDRALLDTLPGPARVVCLPTAAGAEGAERIQYWADLGINHFKALGVTSVESLPIIDHTSACDLTLAARVAEANFVYLSGGKPSYLRHSLENTPVWEAIQDILQRGGVVAGCSAGAMVFGERIPSSLMSSTWLEGFNFLPGVFVMPHFDELPSAISRTIPTLWKDLTLVGIEGYTALVCSASGCQVLGRGSVTIARGRQREQFYEDGLTPLA
jgi:cyanophycinase